MVARARSRLFTIPPGVSFVDALAHGLIQRHGAADPMALADVAVLVPTRRAVRALEAAFLRQTGGRPLLLPAIRAVGDVGTADDEIDPVRSDDPAVPEAISILRRLGRLTTLVSAKLGPGASRLQATGLAADLAGFLDQVQTERLDFDRLDGLAPGEVARHWQEVLEFLAILRHEWPRILAAEGLIDPAARRDLMLRRQAEAWRARPPAGPVYLAGSTGSVPATAELAAAILTLPAGAVVLPGLDQASDDETWAAIAAEPGHPQFGLAQLLDRLGQDRAAVRPWPSAVEATPRPERVALLREALRPVETTDRWAALAPPDAAALDGLALTECPGQREEAMVIALALRHTLETPDRSAILVTPDRGLARRVAVELQRWDITVDDSAGVPLGRTAAGTFLRLIAEAAAQNLAPVHLLAVLKHPLAQGGQPDGHFRCRVRRLERAVLRGPRPGIGGAGLVAALARLATPSADLASWLERVVGAFAPLERLMSATEVGIEDLLRETVTLAEWLAEPVPGAAPRLWAGDDGEALARFVNELAAEAEAFGPLKPADWPGLLGLLLGEPVVRPRRPGHARIAILGPLEARLQRADLVVLGGLNEGTWPALADTDPWLSRPMRASFGLAPPERRIGLAAHDFAQLAAADQVLLTRSRKVDGTPTVASRWLLRLTGLIAPAATATLVSAGQDYLDWALALDRMGKAQPCPPPEPKPPVVVRPRQLSVTRIGTLIRDPYAIYARYILGLKPLDDVDQELDARHRGILIHDAMETFLAELDGTWPDDALDRLLDAGRRAFGPALAVPAVRAFWWSRFERAARWFVADEAKSREPGLTSHLEIAGGLDVALRGGTFLLTAKADRIDRLADGGYRVIDYKTGQAPNDKQVESGLEPQLPLEAAIVAGGGFPGLPPGTPAGLVYIRLGGGLPPGERRELKLDAAATAAEAVRRLAELITEFDDPATPYLARPRVKFASQYGDYDHLARVLEWSAGGGEE